MDLAPHPEAVEALETQLKARGIVPLRLSAATATGTRELVRSMLLAVEKARTVQNQSESEDA